jgi:hypothetical protein
MAFYTTVDVTSMPHASCLISWYPRPPRYRGSGWVVRMEHWRHDRKSLTIRNYASAHKIQLFGNTVQ